MFVYGIRETKGISPRDGQFLAGFLEAESSFSIRANNGGQSWQCSLSVNLRDDDADLLVELQRLTGLGKLRAVSAYGTSNPQAQWRIVAHADCLVLAEILEVHPLRGRKRREAQVWCNAVRALTAESRPECLPLLRSELLGLRRYVDAEEREAAPGVSPIDDLTSYLGGFFTGEGHLLLTRDKARIAVRVRDDDRPLLEALAEASGLGSIYRSPAYGTSRPAATWMIHRRDQMRPAVDLLERAGLRGRKLREFEVWREGAVELTRSRAERSHAIIERSAKQLRDIRRYRGARGLPPRVDRHEERKKRYIAIIQTAADLTPGELTTARYLRVAQPGWPNRNTISRAFGSWAAALAAAGLADRCTQRARTHAAVPSREYTDEELARRRKAREHVLEVVRDLASRAPEDRFPTVDEFLAYRAANDIDLPSLNRLYNLFPAGWWSVLRQAGLPVRQRGRT